MAFFSHLAYGLASKHTLFEPPEGEIKTNRATYYNRII